MLSELQYYRYYRYLITDNSLDSFFSPERVAPDGAETGLSFENEEPEDGQQDDHGHRQGAQSERGRSL